MQKYSRWLWSEMIKRESFFRIILFLYSSPSKLKSGSKYEMIAKQTSITTMTCTKILNIVPIHWNPISNNSIRCTKKFSRLSQAWLVKVKLAIDWFPCWRWTDWFWLVSLIGEEVNWNTSKNFHNGYRPRKACEVVLLSINFG